MELDDLLQLTNDDFTKVIQSRQRRSFARGLKKKEKVLIAKLASVKAATAPGEKPKTIRTHLRSVVIVPAMIGSVVGVYNGQSFITVDIRPEMVGHKLAEFSITYKPVRHRMAGATSAAKVAMYMPLRG
jgi:small subunit ribosomal protein S15e